MPSDHPSSELSFPYPSFVPNNSTEKVSHDASEDDEEDDRSSTTITSATIPVWYSRE
jgi:hypothetical protein